MDQPRKILLIEDNESDVALVKELFADAGWDGVAITHVTLLKDALQSVADASFDAILLDLGVPDGHGLGTVSQVRDAAHGTPLIILSRSVDDELALQALEVGAHEYLRITDPPGNQLTRSVTKAIERQRHEDQLNYLAQHDHLTGLVNRALFRDRLAQAMSRSTRESKMLAVVFVDLDDFKKVNDKYGNELGDTLIRSASQRLRGCVRKTDTLARLGGDQFAIVCEGIRSNDDCVLVCQKVHDALSQPFFLEGNQVATGASVGTALFPQDANDPERLIACADDAMYRAKRAGGDRYQLYA